LQANKAKSYQVESLRSIEEYKSLREEILTRGRGVAQVIITSLIILVPFISTIIVYVTQHSIEMKKNPNILYPYIFLCPLLIVIPCTFFLISLRKDIYRYGTYIQVFYEEGSDGPKWETMLHKFRQIHQEESFDPTFWLYWALFFICGGFFGYILIVLSFSLLHLIVPFVAAMLLLKSHYTYRQIPTKIRKKLYNNWLEIKRTLGN